MYSPQIDSTMSHEPMKQCCMCHGQFNGFGNNPEPVVTVTNGERCCDTCNHIVILRRINDMDAQREASQEFYLKRKAR